MYYLRSRYYTPQHNRFLNSDAHLFDKNLYTYCKNCPVTQADATGEASYSCLGDGSEDPSNTIMADDTALGGGTWGALMSTLQSATDGLNMALGTRDMSRFEKHHVLSKYRKQFTEITDNYGMDLDSETNIVELPGHRGRHTDFYHDLMMECLTIVDQVANRNEALFYEGFKIIYDYVKDHPWLPYAK